MRIFEDMEKMFSAVINMLFRAEF